MTTVASDTTFAVVFSLFVVATVVLVVLTIRFTVRRAAAARALWLEGAEGPAGAADDTVGDAEPTSVTALVLAGGGTRGAVQVGMLQVLTEHGFRPDRIFGSSVGAVNGVAFAGDPTRRGVERMTEIWRGLTRDTVYPQGRLHGPWMYLQQRDSVYPNSGLRTIVENAIDFESLEEAVVPVEVVATSLTDGRERWFTYGPAVEAVLASAAIPAIYPPVEIDGDRYIDGGVVNNVPIQRAVDAGATRIVVLLCSPPMLTPATPRRPIEAMLNALFISIHARFARDMAHLPAGVEVIVCSGAEGGARDFDDFSTTETLIAQGRAEASEVIRRYGLGLPPAVPFVGSDPTGDGTTPLAEPPDTPDPILPAALSGADGHATGASRTGRRAPDRSPPVAGSAPGSPRTQPDPGR
jgi:NTE family protein